MIALFGTNMRTNLVIYSVLALSVGLGLLYISRPSGFHLSTESFLCESSLTPKQKWPALYDNVVNRPPPATYVHQSPVGVAIAVTMTIFNMGEIIELIIQGMLDTTTGPYEFIAVFDNCDDDSVEVVQRTMDKYQTTSSFSANKRANRGCTGYKPIILNTPHYETLANNIGLRATTAAYAVVVQDDMLLVQTGWDRHLLRPALGYSDVLGVSGRCAHNDRWRDESNINIADEAGFCHSDHHFDVEFSDTFSIRDHGIRGPLLVDVEKMRQLDFFSEDYYPFEMDDHDVCLRAYQQFGYVCGVSLVSVHTDRGWSHRRKDGSGVPAILKDAEKKNKVLTIRRHASYLREAMKHNEDRKFLLTD